MECINCGQFGHSFRECRAPVMSYGIVAVKFVENIPYYLLIQRRDSMSYVEFLRGKYRLDDSSYIKLLIDGMTKEERARLLSHTFDTLWTNLWNSQNTRQYRNEYEAAKKQFETLKTTGNTYGKILASFLAEAEIEWPTPEWGFPKGRRNTSESVRTCALREFSEETGIAQSGVHLLSYDMYIEQYVGTNGIEYKQSYFIGYCNTDAHFEATDRVMTREIGNVAWLTYEQAMSRIRPTNKEKRDMLTKIHKDVQSDLKPVLENFLLLNNLIKQ